VVGALGLLFPLAFASGCAHAGAGTEADSEAAVAAGVLAAVRLYLPPEEAVPGLCVEVSSSSEFEQGVVALLQQQGTMVVTMPDCGRLGRGAALWVRVLSYDWVDWLTHGKMEVQGTVETHPAERANFRLSWWRASFRARLAFQDGQWVAAADDLGRI